MNIQIAVILGTTRTEGNPRLGERVGKFVLAEAANVDGATFKLLDLVNYDLPFFNEAIAPLTNKDRHPIEPVRHWLSDMAQADGYVFVTTEYNFAVPAVLKNALDYLAHEAERKPALIQSYSNNAHGGMIAGNGFRLIINKLGMLPVPLSLPLAHAERLFNEAGELVESSEWSSKILVYMPHALKELVWYADALKVAREKGA